MWLETSILGRRKLGGRSGGVNPRLNVGAREHEMEIVVYPDPRLLRKTAPVAAVTDEVRANVAEMLKLMYQDRGVGLAAPQVGWSARVFVMNPSGDAAKPEDEVVLINPKLVKRAGRIRGEEGCLSFPGIYVEVERAKSIVIQWTDL